jgi:hypothetical protein
LLKFYRYARSKKKLLSFLGGKPTLLVFFLDKDVDDLRRTKCRSPHVIYTRYYDIQNHVFRHANFSRAVSSAASIDVGELLDQPIFNGDWCQTAARRWREWIALCLLAVRHGIPGPNYRVTSQVNDPPNGPLDVTRFTAAVGAVTAHLGVSATELDRRMKELLRRVDRSFVTGTYDFIFKGKWYAQMLEWDLRTAFAGRAFQFNGVADRAAAAMVATLDFSQPWADHFVQPLTALVDRM